MFSHFTVIVFLTDKDKIYRSSRSSIININISCPGYMNNKFINAYLCFVRKLLEEI